MATLQSGKCTRWRWGTVFEWILNRSKPLIHSRYVMKHAVEIILTLNATFKGSADQQSVDAKTDFAFLGHDNLFSQIYMTQPKGQTQVIARAQLISLIRCLFRLVKCKFTEPLYKSAWYTLLSLLIFSTYALSIKREGRNLQKKKKKKKEISRLLRLLHSSAVMLVNSVLLRYCGYRDSPKTKCCKQRFTVKIKKKTNGIIPLKIKMY